MSTRCCTQALAAFAAVLLLGGTTTDAGATVTIHLSWGACGGGAEGCTAVGTGTGSTLVDTIALGVGGGQTLRLDIFLSHDEPGGLVGHGFSINFDTDLLNELNLNGAMVYSEWGGTDVDPTGTISLYSPIDGLPAAIESGTGGPAGRLNTFESGALIRTLPVNGAAYSVGTTVATAPDIYRVGQIFFVVNGAVSDGADVFTGLFNSPFDAILDSSGAGIPGSRLSFGTATLNVVPEPGTVSLLGLGLVGLVLAGRRSRRS